ncbi:hypothetical protein E4U42_007115 [Claviceps africana]|uniref:FAR1 domain-containing protein n=1 Tax=Claviceps africana TaxID=83212 RepID=A0A8K0J2D3_9HYPO|nr:hypothetical protein E4U42_007115 [Claviceps africana]
MFGILTAAAVPHSGIFNTYEDLILHLNKYMERQGFKIVKTRSHRRKPGGDAPGNEIVRCDLVCDRGGRAYKCLATKHKTKTKKTDCPWKAKAVHQKGAGGWVLTILCDQHNHEAGTPEPPTPAELNDDAADDTEPPAGRAPPSGPQLDANTSAALQVAGISSSALRLTGDTFQQLKTDYRKMSQPERLNALAQLQLRLAAIYTIQNEDMQRQQRQMAQDRRHLQADANRKVLASQKHRSKRQQKGQVARDQPSQEIAGAAEPHQGLPHDLLDPETTHAPQAFMEEQHFQVADAAGGVGGVSLPHFAQFPGPGSSGRTRGDRTNPT